jgi:hypothetical protein
MDTNWFDEVARRLRGRTGRRRVLAALGAGAAGAALGWLRPRPAAARPYCGNCGEICDNCFAYGTPRTCRACERCALGQCYECPGPEPCA